MIALLPIVYLYAWPLNIFFFGMVRPDRPDGFFASKIAEQRERLPAHKIAKYQAWLLGALLTVTVLHIAFTLFMGLHYYLTDTSENHLDTGLVILGMITVFMGNNSLIICLGQLVFCFFLHYKAIR